MRTHWLQMVKSTYNEITKKLSLRIIGVKRTVWKRSQYRYQCIKRDIHENYFHKLLSRAVTFLKLNNAIYTKLFIQIQA
jgi:hypothetical protein